MSKQPSVTDQIGWPSADTFNEYTLSRWSHLRFFKSQSLDLRLYKQPRLALDMDLKIYQDLLAYAFITHNVPSGACILDIGGGNSRILSHFAGSHECWNIDKLEGVGNGPQEIKTDVCRLVCDYMGNFNPELPDNYFDFVFSISALEHVPDDVGWCDKVIRDINRVMKLGAYSLHMLDCLLVSNARYWFNPILKVMFDSCSPRNAFIPLDNLFGNPSIWYMSRERYEQAWRPKIGKPYEEFGRPVSYNVLWQKP